MVDCGKNVSKRRELLETIRDSSDPKRNSGGGARRQLLLPADLIVAAHVYTGICVDTACSLGSCAEYSAIAEMLKARESEIDTIVAVCGSDVVPPCGRCRELIRQINAANTTTRVIIGQGRVATVSELLPFEWSVSPGQDGG